MKRVVNMVADNDVDFQTRTLYITHVNHFQRAKELKEAISERVQFKDIQILECSGLVATYANDGGIIIAY